jgi:hypothetical protein
VLHELKSKLKRNPAVAVLNQPHSGYRLTFRFATGAAFGPRIFPTLQAISQRFSGVQEEQA